MLCICNCGNNAELNAVALQMGERKALLTEDLSFSAEQIVGRILQ